MTLLSPIRPLAVQAARSPQRLARLRSRRRVRLWLPITPLALMLTPLALLALPIVQLIATRRGLSPWPILLALGGVLIALSGTVVEVDSPTAQVRIRIW